MGSWPAMALHLNRLPFASPLVATATVPKYNCSYNLWKVFVCSRGEFSSLRFRGKGWKLQTCAAKLWHRSSTKTSNQGTWEEPDDGSDSEYDVEEEESEENELEFESDWEPEEENVSTVAFNSYEDDLMKEVDELLSPEERRILDQNTAPDLEKISTICYSWIRMYSRPSRLNAETFKSHLEAKWSSLHTLALAGQIPFMDKLLENGVEIDMIDQDGHTALHKAVMGKKEAVISHLLRKGSNPHVKDQDGASPLHYEVQVGALQTVKLLIKYKVDVNVADNEGWTPLHIAMQTRKRDVAKVLLVNGADNSRKNEAGNTPLDLSLCYGKDFKSYELAKLLKLVPASRDF